MMKRATWLWPLILIGVGVVLLLDNFLLIDIDVLAYWPVLFVLLGVQVLVRGDIALTWQSHTFGITRGSVQAAALEIESGEIDVQLRMLRKPGRLIAGQYTARSRPELVVRNNQARLRMQRGQTWWLSLADWDVGLAHDLPWELLVSSHLGNLEVDLRELQIDRSYVSSGLGHITVVCPARATGPIFARSTFGDVRLSVPERSRAVVTVKSGPFARVRVDRSRYTQIAPGVFATHVDDFDDSIAPEYVIPDPENIDLDIITGTAFGSIYIS